MCCLEHVGSAQPSRLACRCRRGVARNGSSGDKLRLHNSSPGKRTEPDSGCSRLLPGMRMANMCRGRIGLLGAVCRRVCFRPERQPIPIRRNPVLKIAASLLPMARTTCGLGLTDSFNPRPHLEQDSDPAGWWEETWMGHTDSKPKGPEAMSLDLVFPGFQNVYGIPERATSLSLRPTNGAHAAAAVQCRRADSYDNVRGRAVSMAVLKGGGGGCC